MSDYTFQIIKVNRELESKNKKLEKENEELRSQILELENDCNEYAKRFSELQLRYSALLDELKRLRENPGSANVSEEDIMDGA